MKEFKVYKCPHCGKIVFSFDSKGSLSCCGTEMIEQKANTTDAAQEKHVPKIEVFEDYIAASVGEVMHPMTVEHSILWIALVSDKEVSIRSLNPEEEPKVLFPKKDHGTIYAYCNLHGLWKKEF